MSLDWITKMLDRLAKVFRLVGPLLVLLFTAAHGLGLFEKVPWLEINFAFVGLWFTAVVLEFAIENREEVEKLANLTRGLKDVSAAVAQEMEHLRLEFQRDRLDSLGELRKTLDPRIDSVIGAYVDEHLGVLYGVFRDQTLELDKTKFRILYSDTLRAYPKSQVFATSYPSARYFWSNSDTEQAMRTFVRNGGEMTRIFFLKNAAEANDPEANLILSRQKEINVDVRTLVASAVPQEWQKIFLVVVEGDEERIGWELTLSRELDIEKAVVTWERGKIQQLRDLFRKIRKANGVTPFGGAGSRDPNASHPAVADAENFERYEHQEWERHGVAKAYDRYFGVLAKQAAEQLLKMLLIKSQPANQRLLDVASGPGYLAAAAKAKGMDVTAIDFSASVIGLAQERHQDIYFQIGNAEKLEFTDGQFDAVAINLGVMHFAKPELAFQEAFRALKPGGRFGFSAWTPDNEGKHVIGSVQGVIQALGDMSVKLPDGPPYFRYGESSAARTALESVGFRNVRVSGHELIWELHSGEELFRAFAEGTARMGGSIRAQALNNQAIGEAIRETVIARAACYETPERILRIPMPYVIITAEKPM
jgi:SAM-dependent methyltransferase